MPEPNQIKTQLVVEDQFSRSFSSLNGSLMDATYASQKFERGFTNSMNSSAMASQNFSNQFNSSFAQVNGTLQQTNASMNSVNNNPAFSNQSGLFAGVIRFRNGINETRLLVNDLNDAFNVLSERASRNGNRPMSLFQKIGFARKVIKFLGVDGLKRVLRFIVALDAFKDKASSSIGTLAMSLDSLSERANELVTVLRPFIKIAARFVPFLNVLLPYIDRLPGAIYESSNSIEAFGQNIDSLEVPGANLVNTLGEIKAFFGTLPGQIITTTAAVTGLFFATDFLFKKVKESERIMNVVNRVKEFASKKLEDLDIKLLVASKSYSKFRLSMMKFGKLDGAYFGIKNLLSDGIAKLKNNILKSDIGISTQIRIATLKKKLDELDAQLMWHSRTYAKFRNKMMEKGFWGAVSYYIKRADSYLINHSEQYVKLRKVMNKTINKALDYYEKKWKNLFTSSRIYLSSFKRDLKDAFLVKDIADDGTVTHSFLPSYFFKNLTDLDTYKNLWGKCREYLGMFYKDLKDTPLGGPLQKLEDALSWVEDKFGGLKDTIADWKLSIQIYFASVTNYIKENINDWILSAKIYFAYHLNKLKVLAGDLMNLYLFARKVVNYFKFLKFSWDTLNLAKEKVSELVQETEYLQKRKAIFVQFGKEAGEQFTRFAERASLELGKTKDEILDTGIAFRKIGFSGKSIEDIINLSDRLEDLNPGQSFQGIRDSFLEAFKSGSSEGLAELIGGGRGTEVERAFRKVHLDRYLRKGDVQGFLTEFKKVADQFGYTQEKADEMDETIHAKLGKVSSHLDRLSEQIKTSFFDRLAPYVDKFLDFINSPEFQAWFQKTLRQVMAIIDIVGFFIEKIIDVGVAIVKWWIEPSGEFLRRILMVAAMFMFFRRAIAVVRVLSVAFSILGAVLSLLKHPIKMIIRGFKKAKEASSEFFHKTKDNAMMLSSVASLLVTGLVIGGSYLYKEMTGESHGMLEDFLRFFVPGIVTGWYNILNAGIFVWNKIRNVVRNVMQGIIETVYEGIKALFFFMNPLLWIINQVSKFFDSDTKKKEMKKEALEMQLLGAEVAHGVMGDDAYYAKGGVGEQAIKARQELIDLGVVGERKGIIDKVLPEKPVLDRFDEIKPYTDDEIFQKANDALAATLEAKDKVLDAFGLNTLDSYQEEWKKIHEEMDHANDHLGHIRKNTKEMDLLWMKQLAEQRFVNNVNVRQLTPNINVKVSGSKSSAQDTANAIARELSQMADAGTFNAYGSPA